MMRHNSPVDIGPPHSAPMVDKISLLNAMISPPNTHSIPWLRWLASWDWMLMPSWTMPQPRMITPMALMQEKSRVSAQRLTALLRQVSKRSPPNRTYTSLRIRLSRNQSNFPACNRSWQDTHNAIVFLLRPIMARSHAALPFKFLSFLT